MADMTRAYPARISESECATIQGIARGQWWEMRLVFDRVRSFLDNLDDETVTTREESKVQA